MTEKARLRDRMSGLSLGMFAADHGRLRAAAEQVVTWGAAALHFDVMDGVFVPAITGGPGFVAALDVGLPRDVHLMVEAPSRQVAAFAEAGADAITVHAEAPDAAAAIAGIRAAAGRLGRPILAGLALMPDTGVDAAAALLDLAPDLVLVLAVDPRRKAPPAIDPALAKLARLKAAAGRGCGTLRLRRRRHPGHDRCGRHRHARPCGQRQRGLRGARSADGLRTAGRRARYRCGASRRNRSGSLTWLFSQKRPKEVKSSRPCAASGRCSRASPVLKGIDFEIRPGKVHALLGGNGSGKSTMVKILSGAYQPTAGTIAMHGKACRPSPARRKPMRHGIYMVPQEPHIFPQPLGRWKT